MGLGESADVLGQAIDSRSEEGYWVAQVSASEEVGPERRLEATRRTPIAFLALQSVGYERKEKVTT